VYIAIYGNPSHNYGVSLAVWDHTVLPSTLQKRTHPAFTPATQAGTRFTDHLKSFYRLCNPIWQVTPRSSEMTCQEELYRLTLTNF